MPGKDLYAILGVKRSSTKDEIRKAYRKLARKHHPDVNQDDPKATERFKEASHANDVLADDDKRRLYDEFGDAGLATGFDPEQARAYQRWNEGQRQSPFGPAGDAGVDLEDLFSGIFGQGRGSASEGRGPFGGARRGRRHRTPDAESTFTVSFLDAVRGHQVALAVEGGNKIKVTLPPGTTEGTRIRLPGQSKSDNPKMEPGDLYLTIRVRPHSFFRREGDDIHLELPVTIPELLRGGAVRVPTPDGAVDLKIPARSPNGRTLRVRGKGAARRPTPEKSAVHGDLYAHLVATLPEGGDDSVLERIAVELDALYIGKDVRRGFTG